MLNVESILKSAESFIEISNVFCSNIYFLLKSKNPAKSFYPRKPYRYSMWLSSTLTKSGSYH